MDANVEQALEAALRHWKAMSGADNEEAESTADAFQASFYHFIDAVREWINGRNPRPQTLEAFLEMTEVQEIVDRLPAPLYLNFETEAELLIENKQRIDDDKYD